MRRQLSTPTAVEEMHDYLSVCKGKDILRNYVAVTDYSTQHLIFILLTKTHHASITATSVDYDGADTHHGGGCA